MQWMHRILLLINVLFKTNGLIPEGKHRFIKIRNIFHALLTYWYSKQFLAALSCFRLTRRGWMEGGGKERKKYYLKKWKHWNCKIGIFLEWEPNRTGLISKYSKWNHPSNTKARSLDVTVVSARNLSNGNNPQPTVMHWLIFARSQRGAYQRRLTELNRDREAQQDAIHQRLHSPWSAFKPTKVTNTRYNLNEGNSLQSVTILPFSCHIRHFKPNHSRGFQRVVKQHSHSSWIIEDRSPFHHFDLLLRDYV